MQEDQVSTDKSENQALMAGHNDASKPISDAAMRMDASCERLMLRTHKLVAARAKMISEDRAARGDTDHSLQKQDADWYEAENQLCDVLEGVFEGLLTDIEVSESAATNPDEQSEEQPKIRTVPKK